MYLQQLTSMKRYLQEQLSKSGRGLCRISHLHFIEAFCDAIDVDKPCDVFVVAEVAKKSEFAQCAFRERCLCEDTRNHFYCNGLPRDFVYG